MGELVSVAPLMPSHATQARNLKRWHAFWREDDRAQRLASTLQQEGKALGFSSAAFGPFLAMIDESAEPFSVSALQEVTGPMLSPLIAQRPSGLGLVTLVPDGNEAVSAFGPDGLTLPDEAQAVSQQRFAATLRSSLAQDFQRFLLRALVMVILVLTVALRRLRMVVLCLLPALTGLLVMLAVMGATGLSVNMFNMAASVLVLGLSIDYGVFMVRRAHVDDGAEQRAVVASALTTLSGFGALALAQHPAMFSLGITVVLGIVPAMLCALWIVPALQGAKP
jgi:predicted exporter